MKYILTLLFLFSFSSAWALPLCEGTDYYLWNNCYKNFSNDNGDRYSGEWKDGQRHGGGTIIWINGDKYEGGFESDLMHGEGTFTFADGRVWVGVWKKNKFSSGKKYTKKDFKKVINSYKEKDSLSKCKGWHNCIGDITFTDNGFVGERYIGRYMNTKQDGEGKYYYPNGAIWIGWWENNSFSSGQKRMIKKQEKKELSNSSLYQAKLECEEIGFKKGTEAFGECVLDLTE